MRTKMDYHEYLTETEIYMLFRDVDNIETETMFRVGIDTGLRINDFLRIEISNINFEKRIIKVWQQKKRNTIYPVLELKTIITIQKYLKTLEHKQKYLFENKHTHTHYCHLTPNYRLSIWCKKIGINDPVSWHMLRRTYINLSRKKDRDFIAIAKQIDDNPATILKHYAKANYEDQIKESDKSIFGSD